MARPPHENDQDYDWAANSAENPIPSDLARYHRQFKPGYWGYVCPSCHYVFPPGLGGMPGSFRVHLREFIDGRGCLFKPKTPAAAKAVKMTKVGEF